MDDKELFEIVPYSKMEAENRHFDSYSYWSSVFYNFFKKKYTIVMLVIFLVMFFLSIVSPIISGFSPDSLVPDLDKSHISPCIEYLFGTDSYGRDYWPITWYACGISIKLAILVACGEMLIGVVVGLVWGYIPQADGVITIVYNFLVNIPVIVVLTLVTLFAGQNFWIMALSLILLGWMPMAIEIRNLVLMYKNREYNLASKCLGTPVYRILIKNILPYLVSVITLNLALSIPNTIALESTLSFLGLGLDVNTPSLGVLLKEAKNCFISYPYQLIIPSVMVALISITFYLVGNSFSDATDPKNHR